MWKRIGIISAALILGAALGGIAYASIPGPDGVIHGCYKNNTGALLAIDSAASCPSGYTALNWNQTGPAGPQGPAGADGVSGYEQVSNVLELGVLADPVVDSLDVACPSGKVPLGGGDDVYQTHTSTGQVQRTGSNSAISSLPLPNGWRVIYGISSINSAYRTTVVAYVTCASVA